MHKFGFRPAPGVDSIKADKFQMAHYAHPSKPPTIGREPIFARAFLRPIFRDCSIKRQLISFVASILSAGEIAEAKLVTEAMLSGGTVHRRLSHDHCKTDEFFSDQH